VGDEAELRCWQLAAQQHGVIRRDQALLRGVTEGQIARRLSSEQWVVLLPSVYGVAGSPRDWRQQLMAVSLWAVRGFAFSHRTAAALWRLARFREAPVELTVTRDIRLAVPLVVHHARFLASRDTTVAQGFAVTSPTRTLVDLCAQEHSSSINASVDELLRRRLTSPGQLSQALERLGKRRGVSQLRSILRRYQGGECATESELEAVALDLIDSAGLPRPAKQRPIAIGGRLRRIDFTYDAEGVVIEADGFKHHGVDFDAFEHDRERDNALTARGYCVLRWTWLAIHERPDTLADELRMALARRRNRVAFGR
jgi:very-short-patch-repair endonuclease